MTIGFIGQGFIGKNYADDFERRGLTVVRYALEEPYRGNKEKIKDCDVVFIAVPTPTVPAEASSGGGRSGVRFDDSIVREAIGLVGVGKTAVVKSTIVPGSSKSFQAQYQDRVVLYSPEFLSESTAAHDAAHPFSNIVGMPLDDEPHRTAAAAVHEILPKAPFTLTCDSTEAELIKYAHNVSGYTQVVTFNVVYELARKLGVGWDAIGEAIAADPLVSNRYANPVHKSGRGAGGHCFIKDLAAFAGLYESAVPDPLGLAFLRAAEQKNIALLSESGKDADLLHGVYGEKVAQLREAVTIAV